MSAAPVEGKVNAQALGNTVGLALAGLITWALGVLVFGAPADAVHAPQAAAAVPAQVLAVLALLPIGLGYACGYMAKHTPRPVDLGSGAELVAGPDLSVTAAALAELRAIVNRPVTIKLDGKTVATTAQVSPAPDDTGSAPSVEGQSMVNPAEPVTDPSQRG